MAREFTQSAKTRN